MSENLTIENGAQLQPKRVLSREKKRLIFYILIVLLPLMQFSLFYIYVNLDMFLMAFRVYSLKGAGQIGYTHRWTLLENFQKVFEILAEPGNQNLTFQTFAFYIMSLTFVPIGLFFSYYIYKNYMLSGLFRVMLYLPSIVSGVVMTMLYKYMFTHIFEVRMTLGALILYSFLTGFGANVVMYVSAMCGIDTSISESCQLDGATPLREFWSVTVPMIFPTIVTFLVIGVAGIFTNQAGLFTFFDVHAAKDGYQTFGYYMYVQSLQSGLVFDPGRTTDGGAQMTYPQLCALGMMITLIILPCALGLRFLLERYGPSVD